jgi:hypothetical protein
MTGSGSALPVTAGLIVNDGDFMSSARRKWRPERVERALVDGIHLTLLVYDTGAVALLIAQEEPHVIE